MPKLRAIFESPSTWRGCGEGEGEGEPLVGGVLKEDSSEDLFLEGDEWEEVFDDLEDIFDFKRTLGYALFAIVFGLLFFCLLAAVGVPQEQQGLFIFFYLVACMIFICSAG
jgi:hypothetical protein